MTSRTLLVRPVRLRPEDGDNDELESSEHHESGDNHSHADAEVPFLVSQT